MKKNMVLMGTTGLVVGGVLGYYHSWWGLLVALCIIISVSFILKLIELRKKSKD